MEKASRKGQIVKLLSFIDKNCQEKVRLTVSDVESSQIDGSFSGKRASMKRFPFDYKPTKENTEKDHVN